MNRRPAEVFHPGIHLRDELSARGWDTWWLARKSGIAYDVIVYLLLGRIDISDFMAERLSRELGTSKEFWINLQKGYDDWKKGEK